MLDWLLRNLGNVAFYLLQSRGKIHTWIVIENFDLYPDLRHGCYYYRGLQVCVFSHSGIFAWSVYDGTGKELIDFGSEPTESQAAEEAHKFIDEFLGDDVES